MKKIVCLSTFLVLLLCSYANEPASAKDNRTVRIIANGGEPTESVAIIENGITLIPIRTIAEILNAKIGIEGETGAIAGQFEGTTLRVWANDEFFEFDERTYGFPVPTVTRNGRMFVPLRTLGEVLGYSIRYDQAKNQFSLIKHGFGQEGEIREKAEAFFNREGSVEDLFTMDYSDRIYWEDSSDLRKLPRRSYDFWMGDITFATAREAVVSAGYRSETQTLKSSVETKFIFRREGGIWKIADREWVHLSLDLPADADETAGRLSSENASETQKIVSDLTKHYEAMNGRKLAAAMTTISPYFIEEWERMTYEESTYRDFLKELFEGGSEDRNELLDARVLYLSDAHAVVRARVLFSQTTEFRGEESREYDLLIDMDRTEDGRWTYYGERDLDGDY